MYILVQLQHNVPCVSVFCFKSTIYNSEAFLADQNMFESLNNQSCITHQGRCKLSQPKV